MSKETLDYFKGDELATNVWLSKYALRDKKGNILDVTPDDMHRRHAKEIARIENKYPNPIKEDEVYELFKNFKYIIPGGSVLFGLGNPYTYSSLGNCFVIGNEADSYGGILTTDREQVELMKRRGGVGHDISHLRPQYASVSNSAKSSTGAVSFMPRYSNSTREVAQDGRRGALMLSMSINHQDIDDFIIAKDDLTKITGANISVRVDNAFMECVGDGRYVFKEINETWDKIIHQAWKNAEPGILFWDKIIKESPADCYADKGYKTTSTNPCGEIPLSPYDSCRLLSINLYSFVENPFTTRATFNFPKFQEIARKAQRFMDDIVDLEEERINQIIGKINSDPEDIEFKEVELRLWNKVLKSLKNGRRTGLSGIGHADVFAAMGFKYDSKDAFGLGEDIQVNLAINSYEESINLAKERGHFPIWEYSKEEHNPFILRIKHLLSYKAVEDYKKYGRRNIATLTIPPSGSIKYTCAFTQ